MRAIGKISMYRDGVILGDILKFFPFGFWAVWEQPLSIQINLPRLVTDKHQPIDEVSQKIFNFTNLPKIDFPETPEDHELVLLRDELTSIAEEKV